MKKLLKESRIVAMGLWFVFPRHAVRMFSSDSETELAPRNEWVLPFSLAWVSAPRIQIRAAPCAVYLTTDGKLLWRDSGRGMVRKWCQEASFGGGYRSLRDQLSKPLRAPSFSISHGGKLLSEDFVSGRPLYDFSEDERAAWIKIILRDLITSEPQGLLPAADLDLAAVVSAATVGFPGSFSRRLNLEFIQASTFCSPNVLSAGDLLPRNIVIAADGYWGVDISPSLLGLKPFWFDSLFLMLHGAPRFFFAGGFDAEILRLWKTYASESPRESPLRESLALMTAIWSLPEFRENVPWSPDGIVVDESTYRRILTVLSEITVSGGYRQSYR